MSKAEDFHELADELLGPPEYDYVPGWCKECDREVTANTRKVLINDMPESVAYEVLVGLAETYGYELTPK